MVRFKSNNTLVTWQVPLLWHRSKIDPRARSLGDWFKIGLTLILLGVLMGSILYRATDTYSLTATILFVTSMLFCAGAYGWWKDWKTSPEWEIREQQIILKEPLKTWELKDIERYWFTESIAGDEDVVVLTFKSRKNRRVVEMALDSAETLQALQLHLSILLPDAATTALPD